MVWNGLFDMERDRRRRYSAVPYQRYMSEWQLASGVSEECSLVTSVWATLCFDNLLSIILLSLLTPSSLPVCNISSQTLGIYGQAKNPRMSE